MINRIKQEFIDLMAMGEMASAFSSPPATEFKNVDGPLPDLTGAAFCLLTLIKNRKSITKTELLDEYRHYYETRFKSDPKHHFINDEMTKFLLKQKWPADASVNELKIDSSNLARLLPLAFYFSQYPIRNPKKAFGRYELIHQLTTLSVGHRRASVGAGLLISVSKHIILTRKQSGHMLTASQLKKAVRQGVGAAFAFYNSQSEYVGETGHYALLQSNRFHHLHLEEVAWPELRHSGYAIDTVLMTLWLVLHIKNKTQLWNLLHEIKLVDVGACTCGILALANGPRFIKKDSSYCLNLK